MRRSSGLFGWGTRGPGGRTWHRFAWLADGTWLAINLDMNRRDPRPGANNRSYDPSFSPICTGAGGSEGQPGVNPVVAISFTEFLELFLETGPAAYWLAPGFTAYGDAEEYTR